MLRYKTSPTQVISSPGATVVVFVFLERFFISSRDADDDVTMIAFCWCFVMRKLGFWIRQIKRDPCR